MDKRNRLADIAERAGVSRATVSNFFNHPQRLRPDTFARVAREIEASGYVLNQAARALRTGTRDVVGLVAFELNNPYFVAYLDEIEDRAFEIGLHTIVGNSRGSSAREASYLSMFERERVRGIVAATVSSETDELLREIAMRGTPCIVLGRPSTVPELGAVFMDDERGGAMAVDHLIGIGRTSIAFIGGPISVTQMSQRYRGAVRSAFEHGDIPLLLVETAQRDVQAGREAMRKILADNVRCDAVFAGNDLLAIGVISEALNAGLKVPEDLAVVGYDDIAFDQYLRIPLTSVGSGSRYGAVAMETLERAMMHAGPPETVCLTPKLKIRASTTPQVDSPTP